MRLLSLTIENFVNIAYADITFGKLNVFMGNPHAGKTAVRDALLFALTGTARATDARGAGSEALIRAGSEVAGVTLCLADPDLQIARERDCDGTSLQVSDWTGSLTQQQKALQEQVGSRDFLCAILNGTRFLNSDADLRQELLSPLVQTTVTADELLKLASRFGAKQNAMVILQRRLGKEKTDAFGLDDIDALGARAAEARKRTKERVNKLEGAIAAYHGDFAALESLPRGLSAKQIPQFAGDAKAYQDEALHLEGRIKELVANEGRIGLLQADIGKLAKQLRALEASETPAKEDPAAGLRKEIADLESQIRDLDQQISDAENERAKARDRITRAKARVETLGQLGEGTCPVLEDVECPLAQDGSPKSVQSLQATARKDLARANKAYAQIGDTIDKLNQQCDKLEQELELKKKAQLESKGSSSDAQAEAAATRRLLDQKRAEIEELEDADEKISALKADLSILRAKIKELPGSPADLIEADKIAEKITTARAELAQAKKDLAATEELCHAFGPKGIRQHLVGDAIRQLMERINSRTQVLSGFSVELSQDKGRVGFRKAGDDVEQAWLSDSEQASLGIALTDAIAHHAGADIIGIDAAEIFVGPAKQGLNQVLPSLMNEYETVLVFISVEEPRPAPQNDAIKFFWVENGEVELIKPSKGGRK